MRPIDRQQRAEDLRDTVAIALHWFAGDQPTAVQHKDWVLSRNSDNSLEIATLDQRPVLQTYPNGDIRSYNDFLAKDLGQDLRGHTVGAIARKFMGLLQQPEYESHKYGYRLQFDGSGLQIDSSRGKTLLASTTDEAGHSQVSANSLNQEDLTRFHQFGGAVRQLMQVSAQRTADVELEQ